MAEEQPRSLYDPCCGFVPDSETCLFLFEAASVNVAVRWLQIDESAVVRAWVCNVTCRLLLQMYQSCLVGKDNEAGEAIWHCLRIKYTVGPYFPVARIPHAFQLDEDIAEVERAASW
jgi:hypothetical protein